MRSTDAKDPRPRRRHGRASIATLIALLAVAACAQGLVPAAAVALDDVNDGLGCRPGMDSPPGLGLNDAGEPCLLEGPGGGGSDDEEPEEVIEIEGTAPEPEPEPDVEPCLEIEDCLPPEVDDFLPPELQPTPVGPDGPRGSVRPRSDCRFHEKAYRDAKKRLRELRLERKHQLDALRVVKGWKNLAPPDDQVSEPDLRLRDVEERVRERLKELRDEEKNLAITLRSSANGAEKVGCLDVM